MQILSSTTASQRSVIDKWSQSLSVEERSDAANGHATQWTADNHKPDAADGECARAISLCIRYHVNKFVTFRRRMLT